MNEGTGQPEISVVMPVYNRADLVEQSLASVLGQDDAPSMEVVVVDDGSTDDSVSVVRGIDDPRIRLVSQPNAGVAAARNNGVRQARAPWVYFLDSDDLSLPGTLRALYEAAQAEPQPDVVWGDYAFLQEDGAVVVHHKVSHPEGLQPVEATFRECAFAMGAGLVRRDAMIEAGLFDESFSHSEDYMFWAVLAVDTRWRHVPRMMVHCRQFGDRASTDRAGHVLAHYRAQQVLMRFYRSRGIVLDDNIIDEAVNEYLAFHARKLYWQRRGGAVHRLLWTAARRNPRQWKLWCYWLASFMPAAFFRLVDRPGNRTENT